MKIKFTLERAAGPIDLVATVDSATTVGDLAQRLLDTDPSGERKPGPGQPTLTLTDTNLALDPRQVVGESGLRSGLKVSIGRAGATFVDPHRPDAAIVRVLEGPDAGRELRIPFGSSVIGRERGCEIRLGDHAVSRRHARLNVADVVEIIDLGSANGVQIDDAAVPRAVLRPADVVQIGDSMVSVQLLHPGGVRAELNHTAVDFVRSPRLDREYQGVTLEAPAPPERERRQRFPFIPMLAPLLLGAVLYLITKSLTSIVFVALSPIMLVGSALESRFAGRSEYKRALALFRSDVDELLEEARAALIEENAQRNAEHPAADECIRAAHTASPLLWTRRPEHRGFGEVRVGRGATRSRNSVSVPPGERANRATVKELKERLAPLAEVPDVPITASLSVAALGIAAPRSQALPVARALLAQLAVLHSPAEFVVTAVASTNSIPEWDWLKWLPHTSDPGSPLSARHLASSATAALTLVSELEELLATREDAGPNDPAPVPAILLLVENDAPVEHSRLAALAARGPVHNIWVIWIAPATSLLPAACETFVDVTRDGLNGTLANVTDGSVSAQIRLEQLDLAGVADLARRLSPVVDIDARGNDASDLPRAVPMLALAGTELATSPHAVLERWTENRSIISGPHAPAEPVRHAGTLRAVIGQAAGEAHALDLRADGPHALVGGTTGAGKSELLQTWILAMAAAHSPQRLTFLLVDYKGGSAFSDCVDLPHTVGLVTDLSPHLVRRALTSLSAELTYREHVLARHAAKDLVTLEKQGVLETPPSLVIVVDEFAALVSEVPEFVDGVVNVAQRGRSLGLHLILATQRPAGVIKDNLRANTNLRLALRMADEGDSADVLGSTDAAFFDPAIPGRAVSKTGPGRLVPFQTAYSGGWTTDEPAGPEIAIEELGFGSGAVWEQLAQDDAGTVDLGPSDIRRLVESIGAAGELAEIATPRIPWLPELRTMYDLADQSQVSSRRSDTELVFGIRDDPDHQMQPTVAFHPDRDGNLAVYGTGGAGKSTMLRSIAVAAGFTVRGGPCHVYGIDFGARGLSMLEVLPHVGSVVSGQDHERITRLLSRLRALIDERALRYSSVNAGTITDYRRLGDDPDEPRILLLVDGVTAFRQAYESADRARWFDMFTSIAADGRPVGVQVVLSCDQRSGIPTALASAIQSRVVLRMASTDDYGMLGVPADVLTPTSAPGRGVLNGAEIQVAVLGGTVDTLGQAVAMRGFAQSMLRSGVKTAPAIQSLPEAVELRSLPASTGQGMPVVGIGSRDLEPIGFVSNGAMVLCGPPGSGRTTALRTIVAALHRAQPDVQLVYFGNTRSAVSRLPMWHRTVVSASDAAEAANDLLATLAGGYSGGRPLAIVIEGIGDYVNGPAESVVQQLVKQAVNDGHLVIGEGDTSSFTSGMGLIGQFKAGRAGIALAPDPGDGPTIFKTAFPRLNAADLPPGRGLLVRQGKAELIQIALPAPD